MIKPMKNRVLAVAGVFTAAAACLLLSSAAVQAQEELVVGTYDAEQVAEAANIQQKLQEGLSGLQEKMLSAQQTGDQAAMQQVQEEAMQIQQQVIDDFEKAINEAAAAIAEEAGVNVIAQQVSYTADGVETKDVTTDIVAQMAANGGGGEDADAEESGDEDADAETAE